MLVGDLFCAEVFNFFAAFISKKTERVLLFNLLFHLFHYNRQDVTLV